MTQRAARMENANSSVVGEIVALRRNAAGLAHSLSNTERVTPPPSVNGESEGPLTWSGVVQRGGRIQLPRELRERLAQVY